MTAPGNQCDVDGCTKPARYIEVGDGHALRDPRQRCPDHKGTGLWRVIVDEE